MNEKRNGFGIRWCLPEGGGRKGRGGEDPGRCVRVSRHLVLVEEVGEGVDAEIGEGGFEIQLHRVEGGVTEQGLAVGLVGGSARQHDDNIPRQNIGPGWGRKKHIPGRGAKRH
jgi:hypothetical protein